MCSSSSEEVILAEDETDGEQRHPFDGNSSEPAQGGSQGRWGSRPCGPKGWMFRVRVMPRTNMRLGQGQGREDTGNGRVLLP